MTKKFLIVLALFYTASVAISCLNQCEDRAYFDFEMMSIYLYSPTVPVNDSLTLRLDPLDKRFMSFNKITPRFISAAQALDCDYGYNGMKYPITDIEVTSDSDFNSAMPAGSLLNEIVFVMGSENKLINIDDRAMNDSWEYLYIKERPSLSSVHRLTVRLFKSNGAIISATSDTIEWE